LSGIFGDGGVSGQHKGDTLESVSSEKRKRVSQDLHTLGKVVGSER